MNESAYLNFMKYIIILIVFFTILLIVFELVRNHKIKKKFDLITIKSIKEKDTSLKATLTTIYSYHENFLINLFSKSKLIQEYSNKYTKYNVLNYNNVLIFLRKIEVGFLISLFYIIFSLLEFSSFNFGVYIVIFILSSYLMDISLEVRLKLRNKEINNSLYDSINLLNKCFKAGKSINSSIEYLCNELQGPIKEEFKLVFNDLNHGLSLREAFDRMNDRTEVEDLKYITISLSLLSTNGGSIESLFDSILEDMLNKKKQKDEFKALISSTKFIYKILLVVPIIVVIILSIIHDNYLLNFTKNYVGILILLLVISLYILYILIINKLIKGVK